jgi:VanZ family protein
LNSSFQNPFSRTLRWCSLALALIIILSILILGRDPHLSHEVGLKPPFDKLEHMLAYGVIASLIRMGTVRMHYVTIGILVIFVGSLDEYLQMSLPFRSADIYDLLSDGVGVTLALLFFWWLMRDKASHI